MTDVVDDQRSAKAPPPPLNARAARPLAVRLRGTPVKIAAATAALVLAFAFVWSFILGPSRARGASSSTSAQAEKAPAAVKPAEAITRQPADYAKTPAQSSAAPLPTGDPAAPAAILPVPRFGADALPATAPTEATSEPPPAAMTPRSQAPQASGAAQDAARAARGSALFFTSDGGARPGQTASLRSSDPAGAAPGAIAPSASPQAQADYDAVYGHHSLLAPLSPFEVKAGTLIPAALLTAVDTGRPGPVVAVTTAPVFDTVSGHMLLVPQGSRLIGVQAGDSAYGERRAFLVWKRLILPSGKSMILDDQAATDSAGATGVPGRADHRWLPLGGALLASGAISTLGELARSHNDSAHGSIVGDVGDATAIQAVQVGGRLLDRELNVQPKVMVRAGAPVQVLLTKDLVLEPAG